MEHLTLLPPLLLVALVSAGCLGDNTSRIDAGSTLDGFSPPDLNGRADSDSGTGTCSGETACGGTVVPGTYSITSFCESADPLSALSICQSATLSTTSVEGTGSYTLSADGTYSNSVTLTLHGILAVPASCIGTPGLQTCADLERGPSQASGSGSSASPTVSCSGTGDCRCSVVTAEFTSATGSYSTLGDTLTFVPDGNASPTTYSYCVSGNQIALALSSTSGQASLVLTQQ